MRKHRKSKICMVLLLVTMLFFTMSTSALAGETYYVEVGETFEVPFWCDCNDTSHWGIGTENESVWMQRINVVSGTIVFYASQPGRDTIAMHCNNCGKSDYASVEVSDPGHRDIGLYFSESSLELDAGEGVQLDAYWGDPVYQPNLQFSSSNSSVVSLSNQRNGSVYVEGRRDGSATITVTDTKSGNTDTCYVRVHSGNYSVSITRPSGATYEQYESASPLSVTATVTDPSGRMYSDGITYQWYSGNSYDTCNRAINAATSNYYYPDTGYIGTTYYACVATYDVGSVHATAASTPVAVTVKGQSYNYGIYLVSNDTTIDSGGSTQLVARIYDSNRNLVYGSYDVEWTISSDRYAALSKRYSTTSQGKAVNSLTSTRYATNSNTVTVTARVYINGRSYSDSVTVKIREARENYSVVLDSSQNTLTAGQSAILSAKVYLNGTLATNITPTVEWSIQNANSFASLANSKTSAIRGVASNTLKTNGAVNTTVSITPVAKVTINGETYTGYTVVQIRPGSSTSPVNRIVMQVDNTTILSGATTIYNDVPPVIVNNRTMVPVRVVTELLGGTASWNEAAQTITLNMNGQTLNMTVGKNIPGFDAAPVILNSRTYVPVRYVAEAMGAKVEWAAGTQQIVIQK